MLEQSELLIKVGNKSKDQTDFTADTTLYYKAYIFFIMAGYTVTHGVGTLLAYLLQDSATVDFWIGWL